MIYVKISIHYLLYSLFEISHALKINWNDALYGVIDWTLWPYTSVGSCMTKQDLIGITIVWFIQAPYKKVY